MAKKSTKAPEMQKHTVTKEDLELNPQWVEEGIGVGDEIEFEVEEESSEEAPTSAENAPKASKGNYSVLGPNGEYIRTYTEKSQAEEFVSKDPRRTIVSEESITSLRVNFIEFEPNGARKNSTKTFGPVNGTHWKEEAVKFSNEKRGSVLLG